MGMKETTIDINTEALCKDDTPVTYFVEWQDGEAKVRFRMMWLGGLDITRSDIGLMLGEEWVENEENLLAIAEERIAKEQQVDRWIDERELD